MATVLFDLFGTLVPAFRRSEYDRAVVECADLLGLPAEPCLALFSDSFRERALGEFGSIADNFAWVAARLDVPASSQLLTAAERRYQQFTEQSLMPLPGALETLRWLHDRQVPVGLVSNCAPDVPGVWAATAMADLVEVCAFSCLHGVAKPDARLYLHALSKLGADPAECVYVGDGSDRELTAAAKLGMQALLVRTDLSDTYDQQRDDVQHWNGPVLDRLDHLPQHLTEDHRTPG